MTVPGASEHQIGLALDIVCNDYMSLDEGFGDTKAGKWLATNSCRFGFILRYPEGKENITGIEYEPGIFVMWQGRSNGDHGTGNLVRRILGGICRRCID